MVAENRLHDLGVIPMTSSDAQGMGRAGETWWRTFALAAVLNPRQGDDDNERILRYLAKITVNPALTHGLATDLGRLAVGKLADIVLWEPRSFAAKPWLVLKSGFPAWGVTGDPNASIADAQPLRIAEQFGALGAAPAELSYLLTNSAAQTGSRRAITVSGCRTVRNTDMVRHGILGDVRVTPDGSSVTWEGQPLDGAALPGLPVRQVPISRLHYW